MELPFAEAWKIKMVEPIRKSTRQEREQWLKEAHYNVFQLKSEQVYIDLITDSGTGAMSDRQWAGMMLGDESYAGATSFFKLKEVITRLTGFEYIIPTHQGRAAENVLFSYLVHEGDIVPGNSHFDTTKGHIEGRRALALDCTIDEAKQTQLEIPFKGNVDPKKLEKALQEHGERIPFIIVTITNNTAGGQPVSMQNLREVRALADKYGKPVLFDSARFAENAYFIKMREEGYRNKSIKEITREMFDLADGMTMSAKKDGIVNMGGFIATRRKDWYEGAKGFCVQFEGYLTYGGMNGRDMNALATKLAVFNHDVKLVNPKFVLTSDTLKYSTATKIATILGPSDIVSDQNHIYSERGVYNTTTEQAELLDRSVLTNEGKKLTGDSLFYDRILGYGEAFDNVQMNDTVNRNMLTGDYCFYNELTGSAVATKRAVAIDYSQGDSLFMHGDTLRLITYHMNTDSMYREMRAYHKVRAYRTDVQAVCDSLVYNSKDSCMTMYTDPILWHGEQQLLGEEIKIYMNDSTIDWAHIINQALTVEKKDSIHYNQVSGKEMKAFFIDGDMRLVEVNGNVLVVYYPVEEKDSSLIMMNYSEGGLLKMYLKERRMERGVFVGKTTGTAYPLDQIPPDKSRLPSFVWFDYIRPLNKEDIFEWRAKKAGEVLKKSDRKPVTSPRNMHIKRNNK